MLQAPRISKVLAPLALALALLAGANVAHAQTSSKSASDAPRFEFFGTKPRVDFADAVTPRLGLTGASAIAVPTEVGALRSLSFGLQFSGAHSNLKVGDDRDPQHGFRAMFAIDGGGTLRLAGCDRVLRIEPQRRYEFELHWSWSGSAMRIESLRVRTAGREDVVLESGETRLGARAKRLHIRHSGLAIAWLDSIVCRAR